jgi:uncharacterized membrane-anchored protein YhcB (DUF1043 family)
MNPISWLTGIWGYLGAAVVAGAIAGYSSYWVTSRGYQTEIAQLKLEQANARVESVQGSMDQLQHFITSMNAASTDYQASTQILLDHFAALQREFHNAIKAAPLPADCRPDAQRMRVLTEAITAANSDSAAGGGFGETLRTAPAP